jgi:hypothetical protein
MALVAEPTLRGNICGRFTAGEEPPGVIDPHQRLKSVNR